jgi:hypothetical protein
VTGVLTYNALYVIGQASQPLGHGQQSKEDAMFMTMEDAARETEKQLPPAKR